MLQSDQLLLRSTTFIFTKRHTKAKQLSWECAILHRCGRLLLYPGRMYFIIIALKKYKGRLHHIDKVRSLCVCGLYVGMSVCFVCLSVCDVNLTTIIDGKQFQ